MLIVTVPILCATCIRHSTKGPWTSHLRVTTIGLVLNSNWPSAKTIVLLKVLHPLPDPHHHNSFVFRAGLEPGILAREAGALPRRLKASSVSAPLFEVRGVRFTQPLLAYIRYTHPSKPHSRAGHGTNVTPPPGSTPPQFVCVPSGSRTRDSGSGGGRSTKEAKGYSL